MAFPIPQSAEELKVELVAEEKYHEDRIAHVERNFSMLSMTMGGMARKTAMMRDKGDKLVKTIQDMAAGEYGGTKKNLGAVAECFAALEDYRQTQVDRLETKVVKPLVDYEHTVRKAREELKAYHHDESKEVSQQKTLDRVRARDPSNKKRIAQLQSELQKVKFKRLQSSKALEDHMEAFERKRIQALKNVVGEYINAQMLLHAKALELYTVAYQNLQAVSEAETVQLYQSGLQQRKKRSQIATDDLNDNLTSSQYSQSH